MRSKPILPAKWGIVALSIGLVYAFLVMAYIIVETGNPLGARDFHQFWYAGHFILQGHDPYQAFFAKEQPSIPIYYLDGVVVDHYPVAQPKLETTPSNTPTMLLLLSPFAYFSWGDAKVAFMFINIVLMFFTASLVIRRLPFAGINLAPIDEIFIFLIYIDLSATRIAIENGQTTLFVFLLMMVALLRYKSDWLTSGLALGIALSKYSLSLPIFLFLLYKRKFKILFLAAFVQLLGVFGIAIISRQSPVTIIMENIQLFLRLFDQPGIHLSRWFEALSENHFISILPALLMTLAVFLPIHHWIQTRPVSSRMQDAVDFHLLTVLFIWTMLVAYHRLYDTLILIFFLVLIYKGLTTPQIWSLSPNERKLIFGFLTLLPFVFILPARLVDKVFSDYYGRVGDAVTTLFLIIMLGISMFLLGRSMRNGKPVSTSAGQTSMKQELVLNDRVQLEIERSRR